MGTRIGTQVETFAAPSKVLLVERDEFLGQAAVEILRASGYEVTLAVTAAEAHEGLEQEAPCVILIGSLAPAEARALVGVLRSDPRRTPAVILSSEDRVRALGPDAEVRPTGGHIAALVREPSDLIRLVERYCSPAKPFAGAMRGQRIN